MAQYGVYGNVVIRREYCVDCETHGFVLDDVIQCCGMPYDHRRTKPRKSALGSVDGGGPLGLGGPGSKKRFKGQNRQTPPSPLTRKQQLTKVDWALQDHHRQGLKASTRWKVDKGMFALKVPCTPDTKDLRDLLWDVVGEPDAAHNKRGEDVAEQWLLPLPEAGALWR